MELSVGWGRAGKLGYEDALPMLVPLLYRLESHMQDGGDEAGRAWHLDPKPPEAATAACSMLSIHLSKRF